jgi:hypothetical protein
MTQLGFVTDSYADTEANRVYVSVKTSPADEKQNILFEMPVKGMWYVPEDGDILEVNEVDDNVFVARAPHTPPTDYSMPELEQGEFCFHFDAESFLLATKDGSGNVNINVEASGTLNIDAAGRVLIGDEANAEPLATADHTHEYDYTSSANTLVTGETETPKNGTTTKLESE